jgi:hypothetical protein
MTSFNLEDAIQLRNRLERCREVYRHEWESVRQRWQDLQYSWQDSRYRDFEPDFQRLIHTHDDILEDIERQLQQLEQAIAVVERMKETLTECYSLAKADGSVQPQGKQASPSTENKFNDSTANFLLTETTVQEWQQAWAELSQTVIPFLNKASALATLSLSLFGGIISSTPVTQVTKLGSNALVSGIGFVVGDFQNFIDLNNETLGSDWSTASDESIFKVISKITEDAEKLHFGNEAIAEVAGDYADDEEEKRKRRTHEQKILNQLRSKYSQNSTRR